MYIPIQTTGVQVRFYNSANEAVSVIVYDDKGAKVYSRGLVTAISYQRLMLI